MRNRVVKWVRNDALVVGRVVLLAATASLALAMPSTKPADKSGHQTAEILSSQGMAALSARDLKSSLDAFLDAQQLIKTDKSITPVDPLRVQNAHGLAVAYMLAGKYDKAGEVFKAGEILDKIAATSAAPRALLYNRAVLDLKQKINLMRSIKSIKDYLIAHPENDQELVDLLGTMLDRAAHDERFSKAPLFAQCSAFYMTASEKLEAANPDQRRWGVEWLSLREYKSRSKDRDKIVTDYDRAAAKLNSAMADARSASESYNAERGKAAMGRANSFREATYRKQEAELRVNEYQRLADEKRALIPGFPWLAEVSPLLPNDSKSPTVVAIGPQKPVRVEEEKRPFRPRKPKDTDPTDHNDPTEPPVPVDGHPPTDANPPTDHNPPADQNPPPEPVTEQPPAPVKESRVRVTRYAAAFPVASDLLITSGAAVDHAQSINLEDSQGNTLSAELVRADEKSGLALLRVAGKKFAYINLADAFAGGEVRCVGFPSVAIFSPRPEVLNGKANKPSATGNWFAAFTVNPRLAGAPLITADGRLVGVVMAERDLPPSQTPAVRLEDVKTFLGAESPKQLSSARSDPPYVLMVTVSVSK